MSYTYEIRRSMLVSAVCPFNDFRKNGRSGAFDIVALGIVSMLVRVFPSQIHRSESWKEKL